MTDQTYNYSEIFDSIQGEGHYTGRPTAWMRFFLCNLQCNGFGQDDPTNPDTYKLPYKDIDLIGIKNMEELPVFEFGCDSSYSWSKKFKHLQRNGTAVEIADKVREKFTNKWNDGKWHDRHMCFTGGEPFMKHAQICSMNMMQHWISERDYPKFVTFETNGTQTIRPEVIEFWQEYRDVWGSELFISCSPKLFNVSGETTKRAIRPEVVEKYQMFTNKGQLKFVVDGKPETWKELEDTIEAFRDHHVDWPIWIMPVGATVEGQKLVDGDVAAEAFKRGYNVAARVHTYLWGNLIGV
jgi:6-pyruvoyltetrahydropterin 2'-reductase|tara:strand:- start:3221 stop:4108 length:888 start_codon:yes stop_codon:yes gene_type:complete